MGHVLYHALGLLCAAPGPERSLSAQILWVTGHFWEIVGASRQGLATAWINRARQPKLKIGVEPTFTVPHMQALTGKLAQLVNGK